MSGDLAVIPEVTEKPMSDAERAGRPSSEGPDGRDGALGRLTADAGRLLALAGMVWSAAGWRPAGVVGLICVLGCVLLPFLVAGVRELLCTARHTERERFKESNDDSE